MLYDKRQLISVSDGARYTRGSIFSLGLTLDTETLPPTSTPATIDFENGPWWGGDQYVYTNVVYTYIR